MRRVHLWATGFAAVTLVAFAPDQLMALVVAIVGGWMVLAMDHLTK